MATEKKIKALSITSSHAGFRRARHTFGKEAVVIPVASLSAAQIQQLKDEPLLLVREIELSQPDSAIRNLK